MTDYFRYARFTELILVASTLANWSFRERRFAGNCLVRPVGEIARSGGLKRPILPSRQINSWMADQYDR
jgi:hypothetical protein